MESRNNPEQPRPPRQRVALHDLRFYAYHGYYPEEQLLGNEFFVDVVVTFDYREPRPEGEPGADFEHTVNYEILYRLIREEMEIPRKLLETACYDIFDRLTLNFPFLETISVQIRKSNPPFGVDGATAVVGIDWER